MSTLWHLFHRITECPGWTLCPHVLCIHDQASKFCCTDFSILILQISWVEKTKNKNYQDLKWLKGKKSHLNSWRNNILGFLFVFEKNVFKYLIKLLLGENLSNNDFVLLLFLWYFIIQLALELDSNKILSRSGGQIVVLCGSVIMA